jgi:hypothetical protein
MDIPPLTSWINAIFISGGFWLISKYANMVIYQFKYGGDYGLKYLRGEITKEEKKDLKLKFSWKKRLKLNHMRHL